MAGRCHAVRAGRRSHERVRRACIPGEARSFEYRWLPVVAEDQDLMSVFGIEVLELDGDARVRRAGHRLRGREETRAASRTPSRPTETDPRPGRSRRPARRGRRRSRRVRFRHAAGAVSRGVLVRVRGAALAPRRQCRGWVPTRCRVHRRARRRGRPCCRVPSPAGTRRDRTRRRRRVPRRRDARRPPRDTRRRSIRARAWLRCSALPGTRSTPRPRPRSGNARCPDPRRTLGRPGSPPGDAEPRRGHAS